MNYTALIGNPVHHSVSNVMFKLFADTLDLEYGHLKIPVEERGALKKTLDALKQLGFKGINITLPYKVDVVRYLTYVDETVSESGAVNTIKFKNDQILGYNTDCLGFSESCNLHLKPLDKNDVVFVFGAGGAARAVLQQVIKHTRNVYVFNRSLGRLKALKEVFKDKIAGTCILDTQNISHAIIEKRPNYFINTTSLGMIPNINQAPMSDVHYALIKELGHNNYFLDAVFNPSCTSFLKKAKEITPFTVSGIYWMFYQGIRAFEIWNDVKLSISEERKKEIINILEKTLHEKYRLS